MAAVRARMRCRTRAHDSGEGASAVAFEVELGLEGLVDRLDDLPQWFEQGTAPVGALTLAARTQQLEPGRASSASNPAP